MKQRRDQAESGPVTIDGPSRMKCSQWPGKRNALCWFIIAGLALFLPGDKLTAGELKSDNNRQEFRDPVRDSVGRIQSFDADQSQLKENDSERERQIRQLLPNFRMLREGDSSRELKEQAVQHLQRLRLTQSGRRTANEVLDGMSLYRRLPEVRFEIDPETYDYFVGNPDVVVGMWQSLGITTINLQRTAQYQYDMRNSDGTDCKVYYLKRSKNANVVYCKGEFQSPFLRHKIKADGILTIHSRFEKDERGRTFVRHSADVFVAFPNMAIEAAAKLISPVSNYIADRNFQEISLFMHSMHVSMVRQPGWVQGVAGKMEGVMPERVQKLNELTLKVYEEEQSRMAQRFDSMIPPEPIRR